MLLCGQARGGTLGRRGQLLQGARPWFTRQERCQQAAAQRQATGEESGGASWRFLGRLARRHCPFLERCTAQAFTAAFPHAPCRWLRSRRWAGRCGGGTSPRSGKPRRRSGRRQASRPRSPKKVLGMHACGSMGMHARRERAARQRWPEAPRESGRYRGCLYACCRCACLRCPSCLACPELLPAALVFPPCR